jgi:hypothetical protein
MALVTADLAPFNRCSEALAHMLELHQAAVTAFGSDFIPMYGMLTLIKKKLQLPVQYEIDEIMAHQDTDLAGFAWRQFDTMVSEAWRIATRRPRSYYERLLKDDKTAAPQAAAITPYIAHPGTLAAVTGPDQDPKDKILKCQRFTDEGKLCNSDFIWSTKEQLLHKRLGYNSIPKSCPEHKQPPRAYANRMCNKALQGTPAECDLDQVISRSVKCRLSQAGKCGFGDQCKFIHSEG